MNIKAISILFLASQVGQSFASNARFTFSSSGGSLKNEQRSAGFSASAGSNTNCRVSGCKGFASLEVAYNGVPHSGSSHGFGGGSGGKPGTSNNCDFSVSLVSPNDAQSIGVKLNFSTQSQVTVECSNSGGNLRGIGSPDGCFSATSRVQVQGKGEVHMKDLQIGDKVLTGSNRYQPVYSFGHLHKSKKEKFYQLYTGSSTPSEMTGNHFVFVADGKSTKATRADIVKVGDQLMRDNELVAVTKISTTQKKGLYMPLTADGTIVVDGVLASTYVSIGGEAPTVVDHSRFFISEDMISHWWMSPYRMMCLGVSSNFCKKEARDNEGILQWLLVGRSYAEFAEEQSFLVRVFVLGFPTFFLFGFLNMAEILLGGAALAPLAVLAWIGAAAWFAKQQQAKADKKKVA